MENPIAYSKYMHRKHYVTKFLKLHDNEITPENWKSFCDELREVILEDREKNVLIRLK